MPPPQLGGFTRELTQQFSRLVDRVWQYADFATRTTVLVFIHDDEGLEHLGLEFDQDMVISVDTVAEMAYFAFGFDRDALVSIDTSTEMAYCVLKLCCCIAPARSSPWLCASSRRHQRPSILHAAHGTRARAAAGPPTLPEHGRHRRHVPDLRWGHA